MKIVIVGAEQNKWTPQKETKAREEILGWMLLFQDALFISGDCPKGGVDKWVREIAFSLNKRFKSYPPKKNSWYWYKKRNIKMAKEGDLIIDLEPIGNTSGGTWTANYAKTLGKRIIKVEI